MIWYIFTHALKHFYAQIHPWVEILFPFPDISDCCSLLQLLSTVGSSINIWINDVKHHSSVHKTAHNLEHYLKLCITWEFASHYLLVLPSPTLKWHFFHTKTAWAYNIQSYLHSTHHTPLLSAANIWKPAVPGIPITKIQFLWRKNKSFIEYHLA